MSLRRSSLGVLSMLAASVAFASVSSVRVNSFLPGSQDGAVVAANDAGDLAVAWESRRQRAGYPGVYLQRFDRTGARFAGETLLNLTPGEIAKRPALALDPDGGVEAVFEALRRDGSGTDIVLRLFRKGEIVGSPEIQVNQEALRDQTEPAVAVDCRGGAMVVFTSGPASCRRIMARRFAPDGSPAGNAFAVWKQDAGQATPSIASNGRDGYLVAWASLSGDSHPSGIMARAFTFDGRPLRAAFNLAAGPNAIEPSIAARDDRAAACWLELVDGEYRVVCRRFDLWGKRAWPLLKASATGDRAVTGASVDLSAEGRLTVVFEATRNARHRVITHRWLPDGTALPEAEPAIPGSDSEARLVRGGGGHCAFAGDGRLAVAFTTEDRRGHHRDVRLSVFGKEASPTSIEPPSSGSGGTHDAMEAAGAHLPPVYDPRTIVPLPFGGDPNPRSTGTDFGFVGITNTGWRPPDPILAVGPNHIVTMTNGAIAFFDKSGNKLFQQAIEGSGGFWGSVGAGSFVFDPEVLYDPHSSRFMAVAADQGGGSYFLFAVSDDSDPTGTWYKYRLDVTALAGSDIDSPNMAVDNQAVYLSADFFASGDRYLVYMLDKAAVLTGANPATTNLLITGSQSYGLPVVYDTTAPAMYMLQAFEFGTYSSVKLHAITDPLGTPTRSSIAIAVPSYSHPEDPPQAGTSTRPELFEARFWSCMYRNGSLWAVHHVNGSRVRVRWYEFKTNGWPVSGTPTLAQQGEIDPGGTVRTFFPSIWADDQGNAAITFARSSPTEFIAMWRVVRAVGDPAGTFQTPVEVKTSASSYNTARWGDYSGTYAEPTTAGTFWGVHEYAVNSASWNTFIARYIVQTCPAITISPSSLPPGTEGVAYSRQLSASGGTSPYTFSVSSGTLPAGMTLSASGLLAGTPTASGTFPVTVAATDSVGCSGTQPYTLVIVPAGCPTITISPAALPAARNGVVYSVTLSATGGVSPYNYTVTGGTLPPGLALVADTIQGTPTAAGGYSFTVTATDSLACVGAANYTIEVRGRDSFLHGEGLGFPNRNDVTVVAHDGSPTSVRFTAYGAGQWGVRVGAGDIDGGNYAEILTGPGPGAVYGPHVRGFDRTGTAIGKVSFYAYGTLRYGVHAGGGAVDSDEFDEVLTGPGPGQVFGPHVRGFDVDGTAQKGIPNLSFYAYKTLRYGVETASGEMDGDGFEEILTGPGPGAIFGPHVRGFDYDGTGVSPIASLSFFVGGFPSQGGARVACGDVDADSYDEIVVSPGPPGPGEFMGFDYDGGAPTPLPGFYANPFGSSYGGWPALGDMMADGSEDLVAGAGSDPAADASVFGYDYDGTGLTILPGTPFRPFGSMYGVTTAAGAFDD